MLPLIFLGFNFFRSGFQIDSFSNFVLLNFKIAYFVSAINCSYGMY